MLENAAEYAKVHTEKEQSRYVGRYNLRTRHKIFHQGTKSLYLPLEAAEDCAIVGRVPGLL